jgi:signal-transduction protein with cAMP-binding, CBS, and nucleotidyltransferase domain
MLNVEDVFGLLARRFPVAVFEQGDLVLAERTTTRRLLFFIDGAVEVTKDGWSIARVTRLGAVFGEMAALRDQPHSTDVVAIEPSSFFVVNDAASFLKNEPRIALYVSSVQAERLHAANHSLIAAKRQLAASGVQNQEFMTLIDQIAGALHAAD